MSDTHFPLSAGEQAAVPAAPHTHASRIIRDGRIVDDDWLVLRPAAESAEGGGADDPLHVTVPQGKVIVPLKVWLAQHATLSARGDVGVWLAPDEHGDDVRDDLARLPVIAVDFPRFSDGRGYSTAYLLRSRLGYQGELRAIGDVLRDQMFYMQRVGFNAFAPRADRSIEEALKGLSDFSEVYQAAWDRKAPLFRRQTREVVPEHTDVGYGI